MAEIHDDLDPTNDEDWAEFVEEAHRRGLKSDDDFQELREGLVKRIEEDDAVEEADEIMCTPDAEMILKGLVLALKEKPLEPINLTPGRIMSFLWLARRFGNATDTPSEEDCRIVYQSANPSL